MSAFPFYFLEKGRDKMSKPIAGVSYSWLNKDNQAC